MTPEENQTPIQYQAIVDALREPLLVLDQNMIVLFANAAYYRKFIVSEEETIQREIYTLGDGQWDAPSLRKNLQEIVSHQAPCNDCEITHDFQKLGSRVMLLNARGIDKAEPGVVLIMIDDITERGEAEHKLYISEVRYRKLFETAKDGILLIDPATEKIIDANPFLLTLIGYTKTEILGKELWEIGAMKDAAYAKAMFEELQVKGYVRYDDIPLKAKDGQEREVEFVSNRYPIDGTEMIQCNIRDITDRKTAEKKATMYMEGLEKLNKMMTGREIKMAELKSEIDELKKKMTPSA